MKAGVCLARAVLYLFNGVVGDIVDHVVVDDVIEVTARGQLQVGDDTSSVVGEILHHVILNIVLNVGNRSWSPSLHKVVLHDLIDNDVDSDCSWSNFHIL